MCRYDLKVKYVYVYTYKICILYTCIRHIFSLRLETMGTEKIILMTKSRDPSPSRGSALFRLELPWKESHTTWWDFFEVGEMGLGVLIAW